MDLLEKVRDLIKQNKLNKLELNYGYENIVEEKVPVIDLPMKEDCYCMGISDCDRMLSNKLQELLKEGKHSIIC